MNTRRKRFWRATLFSVTVACAWRPGHSRAADHDPRPWLDYHTIMWIEESAYKKPEKIPHFFQRLREMGINTAMVSGDGDLPPMPQTPPQYYVENIVNRGLCLKWSSNVSDWDKFVTDWAKNGRPESAFTRPYCLDDPEWRGWARGQMEQIARKNAPRSPLCYNIRDELSTTFSANPFDYDFNPVTLARFRTWLKEGYHDLSSLNREWETSFGSWEEVRPFSTDQIKNRMAGGGALPRGKPDWQALEALKFDPATANRQFTRWNFAPWCDFRTYMDVSLAGALADLRAAARKVDPATPVGIEGTQMPSAFGGYDLSRLARALDWVEPYDVGNAREIFGSFMPGKPVLTTVFESDTRHARRRLWHLLLEGDRGCLVWWSQDCINWKSADYELTPKAKALAPALKEMTSPLARLFLRAERLADPVFIHYSQPSIQVDWLLESTVDGSTWLRRFSSFEAGHNRMAQTRDAWLKLFQDLGYSPQFISSGQIESGRLRDLPDGAVLVLPGSVTLSEAEGTEIRGFLRKNGGTNPDPINANSQGASAVAEASAVAPRGASAVALAMADRMADRMADKKAQSILENAPERNQARAVFCDGRPGLFDEHGRLRGAGILDAVFPHAGVLTCSVARSGGEPALMKAGDVAAYARQRLGAVVPPEWLAWASSALPRLRPEVRMRATGSGAARVRIHRYRTGAARLFAFERNIDYQMSEDLRQAGGNERLEQPVVLEASLLRPAHLYDLRNGRYLGLTDHFQFTLDPWEPTLIAATDTRLPEGDPVTALLNLKN
jgi:hypothetical protein